MGYNESQGPPRRMKKHLNLLLRQEETIDFASDQPGSLAYKLREAIHASQFHEKYEHFAKLGDLYEFQVREGHVRAKYVGPQEPKLVGEGEVPESDVSDAMPMTVEEAEGLTDVVGVAMEVEDKTDEIRFPNAVLPKTVKERLFGWTSQNGWRIIDHEEEGITLTRRDVAEEIVWRPE